ncbi:MAG: hypothetical protein HY290_32880 [Planctomycetia bacterium]|nr:hypothetical protein [Planctomycetia bacterium]
MTLAAFIPVLAGKEDAIAAVVVFVITVVSWIAKLSSNRAQKGPPVASRPRPPARPRDDKLQKEISIFVDETASRRGRGAAPARPAASQQQSSAQAKRKPQGVAAQQAKKKIRPGEQMASRQSPVSETLGTGVKQHLSQHMNERVTQEVQQRMAPRVEEQVAADLGATVTGGSARPAVAPLSRSGTAPRAERFAELLRSPAGVQQAIVLNLILSPPPGRSKPQRR